MTHLGPFRAAISQDVAEASLPGGEPLSPSTRRALATRALDDKVTDLACEALADLELELRGPSGEMIATEHISVQDTEYLAALASDDQDLTDCEVDDTCIDEPPDEFRAAMIELGLEEDDPLVDDDCGRELEEDFLEVDCGDVPALPRYQIYVELVNPSAVPVSDRWKDDPDVRARIAEHDDPAG
jgi:hypothetical protein